MHDVVRLPSGARAKWKITATYNNTVVPPKVPGELAIEVVLADDAAKDIEVAAFKARNDVDFIVTQLGT